MLEKCVVSEPKGPVRASVIWFHGLGADGHDFEFIVPQLGVQQSFGVRFIFPHAPYRAITLYEGMQMRAWFDVLTFDRLTPMDEQGLEHSRAFANALIAAELANGLHSEQIILAGFSQGAALAMHAGLRYPQSLGGIVALSGFLPLADRLPQEGSVANQKTPVFLAHGMQDAVLPFACADLANIALKTNHNPVTRRDYRTLAHTVSAEEERDIGLFLTTCLTSIQ